MEKLFKIVIEADNEESGFENNPIPALELKKRISSK